MTYAVTHFVVGMLAARLLAKKCFKLKDLRWISFVGGIGGVLPDFDFAWYYLKKFFSLSISLSQNHLAHRTLTHSLVFALFFLILALIFYKKKNIFMALIVISLGVTTHIALDFLTANNLTIFYPISDMTSGFDIVPGNTYYDKTKFIATLDAVIFLAWICWVFFKKKLTDFV